MRRMPLIFFSFVMGTAGVALMLFEAAAYWDFSELPAIIMWFVALLLWLYLAATYLPHLTTSMRELTDELRDEGTAVFGALSLMSLILLTIPMARVVPVLAEVLWAVAAAVQFLLSTWIYARWISREIDTSTISGAWLLPPTSGNIVAALGAAHFGHDTLAVLLIGAGLVSWIFVNSMITNRQITHRTLLNPAQRPASFVQLNPPVVTINAILPALSTVPLVFEYMLWGYAIFLFTVLLFSLPELMSIPFGTYWWAATFPMSAFALSAIRLAEYGDDPISPVLAPLLTILAVALLIWVGVMTVVSARRHELLPPVPSRAG